MYTHTANKVFYNEEIIFEAPGDISFAVPYKSNLILHYNVSSQDISKVSKEEKCRNVLSIDFNGEVLWRLPKPDRGTLPFHPSYTTMAIGKSGAFWALDGGYMNRFDPDTGEILERDFTK